MSVLQTRRKEEQLMTPIETKLKYIEKERRVLLQEITVAQARVAELNIQRQNLIMA